MKRNCTSCGITIPIEHDVSIAGPVRCWGCRARTAARVKQIGEPFSPYRFEVPQPKNFTREQQGDTLVLTQRWLSWDYLMPTANCLVMGVFLVGCFIFTFGTSAMGLFLVGLPFIMIGFGRFYQVLAGYFNDTRCTVTRHRITINHGPLPWPGNRQVDATAIRQVYSGWKPEGTFLSRRKGDPLNYHYAVGVVLNTGDDVLLVRGIKEEDAKYFEQEIARFLEIEARS